MAEWKRVKLSEQTSDRLYEMIVEEQVYAPGSKLPNENELSEELRVSLESILSQVRALDLAKKVSAEPEIAPERLCSLPD